MAGRLQDKVVLITGASRGVGEACALACAREGAHLALAAKTVEPNAKLPGTLLDVKARVEALGRRAIAIQTDVRFEEQVDAMVEETVRTFGRLDALINNAGAISWGSVADWTAKRFDLVVGVNVRAAFLASRAAIPHLRKQGGHVVMMSPPVNPKAAAGKAPYLTSKIGMTLLAQAIDEEEENVHACALWPVTAVKTAATVNLGMAGDDQMRTPEVLADATLELLAQDPTKARFRAWLDEEVLRELAGVTDLGRYDCVPGSTPEPLSIGLVDPDWRRSAT
ncbi:MAG: SDR family oxidoreductase [Planctomycetes bacterium]|nr:SDR family oxidoreductase [Planctomycetota bacterium]